MLERVQKIRLHPKGVHPDTIRATSMYVPNRRRDVAVIKNVYNQIGRARDPYLTQA